MDKRFTCKSNESNVTAHRVRRMKYEHTKNRMEGFEATSTAIERRFFCSKDSPLPTPLPTTEFWIEVSSNTFIVLSTNLDIATSVMFGLVRSNRIFAENSIVSRTVSCSDCTSN